MNVFAELMKDYPALEVCRQSINKAYEALCRTYDGGGRVYVCGNGGSAADAGHITGELMKGFEKKRPVRFSSDVATRLSANTAAILEKKLQGALPCHNLSAETALMTALINDIDADIIYAQQIYGYGRPGDLFIGISTSGNAVNVLLAAELARAMGLYTIALTGRSGGQIAPICDIAICVPAEKTANVQELHLPVYHALCRAVEAHYFAC